MPFRLKQPFDADTKYQLVLAEVVGVAHKTGQRSVNDREKTTKTWTGERPEFIYRVWVDNAVVKLRVLVADDPQSMAARKWKWIVHGTKIGHAIIINFKAKTRYRTVKSYSGSYTVLFVSKNIRRPGVKARELDDEINKRTTKWLDGQFGKAVRSGLRRSRVTGYVKGLLGGVAGGKISGTGRI